MLDRRIRIDQSVTGKDSIGQPVTEWQTFATTWANIKMLTGLATIKSDASIGQATASVRVRFRTDITAGMRAVLLKYVNGQPVDSTIFDILEPLPDYAGREYTDLVCNTGANNG